MKRRAPLVLAVVVLGLVLALLGVLLGGCSAAHTRPECGPVALAAIEAAYVVEVRTACPDGLPCEAIAEIERRHSEQLEAWILCGSE